MGHNMKGLERFIVGARFQSEMPPQDKGAERQDKGIRKDVAKYSIAKHNCDSVRTDLTVDVVYIRSAP